MVAIKVNKNHELVRLIVSQYKPVTDLSRNKTYFSLETSRKREVKIQFHFLVYGSLSGLCVSNQIASLPIACNSVMLIYVNYFYVEMDYHYWCPRRFLIFCFVRKDPHWKSTCWSIYNVSDSYEFKILFETVRTTLGFRCEIFVYTDNSEFTHKTGRLKNF